MTPRPMIHRHPRDFHTARPTASPLGWAIGSLAALGFLVMAWNGQRCFDGCDHLEHADRRPAAVALADN